MSLITSLPSDDVMQDIRARRHAREKQKPTLGGTFKGMADVVLGLGLLLPILTFWAYLFLQMPAFFAGNAQAWSGSATVDVSIMASLFLFIAGIGDELGSGGKVVVALLIMVGLTSIIPVFAVSCLIYMVAMLMLKPVSRAW